MKRSNKILSCVFMFVLMFIMPRFVLANNITDDDIAHNKYLTSNNDGTYKLLLDVTGKTTNRNYKSNANVIIVLDTSGSMDFTASYTKVDNTNQQNKTYYGLINGEYIQLTYSNSNRCYRVPRYSECYNGDIYVAKTRLDEAKVAVNNLAKKLLDNNTSNNQNTIELALITFASTASIKNFGSTNSTKTTSYTNFSNMIDSLSANGGTNWEAALKAAKNINFNDNDKTYVIFVSDGNPTYYVSGNNGYAGTGQETTDNINTSYDKAKDDAKALVDSGYELYTIGVYGNVDRMQSLNTYSNGSGYFAASNTEALVEAFNTILNKITTSGIGNVVITDGTTASVAAEHGGLLSVKNDSIKYYLSVKLNESYKYVSYEEVEYTFSFDGNNTVTISWGENNTATYNGKIVTRDGVIFAELDWIIATGFYDAPLDATYNNYTINWNVTNNTLLLNDVTYTVSIDVWPSQYTLDLVANLENDPNMENPVSEYLIKTDSGYYLKTNTTAKIIYKNSSKNATDIYESIYQVPDPISTKSANITINKEWVNDLDNVDVDTIDIELRQHNQGDEEDEITSITIREEDGIWSTSRFISPGLISLTSDENDMPISATLREVGHDYSFIEKDNRWDLTSDTIRPMIINDVVKILILTNEKIIFPNSSDNIKVLRENDNTYYKIGDFIYKEGNSDNTITITNSRRSNLNLTKSVIGDAEPDEDYKFKVTVDTKNDEDKIQYSICEDLTAENPVYTSYTVDTKTTNNSFEFEVTLKKNWNLRLINLPINAEYTIKEILDANFVLDSIRNKKINNLSVTDGIFSIDDDSNTIMGIIDESNRSYEIEFVNRYLLTNIVVTKQWNNSTTTENNVTVKLRYQDDNSTNVNDQDEVLLNEDNSWTKTWNDLPKYIPNETGDGYITRSYFVEEIKVNGTLLDNGIYYVKDKANAVVGKWVRSQTSENIPTGINYTITNTYNDMPSTMLNFKKVSFDSDTGLSGAMFKLFRYIKDSYSLSSSINEDDWAYIGNASSNQSGLVEFTEKLYNGTYRLVEVKAPVGYVLPGGNWIIQVSSTQDASNLMLNFIGTTDASSTPAISGGNETIYKISNQKIPSIPTTGGRGIVDYNILGLAIMLVGALSLIFNRKNRLSTDNQ